MKIARTAFLGARFGFALFVVLTSAYSLLAYIPFTYQQFHVGGLFPWLTAFVQYHSYLYWPALALAAVTLLEDLRAPKTRWLAVAFFGFFGAIGVVLLFRPLLAGLENDSRSLLWSLAALLPLLWTGAIDWLGHGRGLAWSERPPSEDFRIFQAAWQSGVLQSLLYAAIFYIRYAVVGAADFVQGGWWLIVTWSLLYHLVASMGIFVALNFVSAVASLIPRRLYGEFFLHGAGALLFVWMVIRYLIFPSVSFVGLLAGAVALGMAFGIVAFGTGVNVRLYRGEEAPLESGVAFFLVPMRFFGRFSWPTRIWFLLFIPGIAYYLAVKTSLMDWEYLLQRLVALLTWGLGFSVCYAMSVRTKKRIGVPVLLAGAFSILGAYLVMQMLQPGPQVAAKGAAQTGKRGLLDEYADYDASFQLVQEAVSRAPMRLRARSPEGVTFYSYLAANTNVPRSAPVAPAPVNLVENLTRTSGEKPNIFIFVIDSLRRDYLSPYNPGVSFTPSIGAFAGESVVMENPFTRYGGTGLSEPSIWVGGMILHKQYIAPFYPMNALERLLEADQYQMLVSKDEVLSTILPSSAVISGLDQGISTMDYDFCRTLGELQTRLTEPRDATRPIFAYTQPQNIHVSVISREGRSVPPGEKYPGFDAACASRVRQMDRCFGGFIQFMKQNGLYDHSIVILTSDHGDSLGERGRWGHAYTLFPEIVRIPLIIHLPSALGSRVVFNTRAASFLTDIVPSLYYLFGHKPIVRNDLFGRPLFTATLDEQRPYLKDANLVASSYAPVYGIIRGNGRWLYVADGVSYKDYLFDLDQYPKEMDRPMTDVTRAEYERLIRNGVDQIAQFYRFHPRGFPPEQSPATPP